MTCPCGGGCPQFVADSQRNATRRYACQPAPTVKFGHAMNEVVWVVDRRTNTKAAGGGMAPTVPVPISEPAPTLTSKSGGQWVIRPPWVFERPATTVVGSFSPETIAAPGYRTSVSRQNAEASVKVTVAEASVKVTVAEASVLQSFRPDYPWQGSRTKKFEQAGNAIPPLLGLHVLASILGVPVPDQTEVAA
ncbi:MAG: DNA cytosine methyltransferase [Actinomycetota bacterium]|nr:DNA cytosine methyltransferase [Actinomycetota bacterium]